MHGAFLLIFLAITMRSHIRVDNIKCHGCTTSIAKRLRQIATIADVVVDAASGTVSFQCDNDACRSAVLSTLKQMGYPPRGKGNRLDQAKSMVSCIAGRIDHAIN